MYRRMCKLPPGISSDNWLTGFGYSCQEIYPLLQLIDCSPIIVTARTSRRLRCHHLSSDLHASRTLAFAALRVYALLAGSRRSTALTLTFIVAVLNVYPFLATIVRCLTVPLSACHRFTIIHAGQNSVQQASYDTQWV